MPEGGYSFNRRDLPSVSSLLADERLTALAEELGLSAADIKRSAEAVLNCFRGGHGGEGDALTKDELRALAVEAIAGSLRSQSLRRVRRVLNATGIIVHTNLGRAPLGGRLLDAARPLLTGYSNLEYELETGRRGQRGSELARILCGLSGAEGALLVNNNAGAVFLILRTLCTGREVVISRGELVQIGGGFRIPDVMAESGAVLREVGTTNHTSLSDYAQAVNENTAAILKVHRSNFTLSGFTAEAMVPELAPLARERGVLLLEDMGAATLLPEPQANTLNLHHPAPSLRAGADIVSFSADKILGLTQGGIILGRAELIQRLRQAPLYRALRPDKWLLTVIELGLRLLLAGEADAIPFNAMFASPPEELRNRAFKLARKLAKDGLPCEVRESAGEVGGGYANRPVPSYALAFGGESVPVEQLAEELRRGRPPVIAVVREDTLLLNVLTVPPEDEAGLVAALMAAAKRCGLL